jgi:uncharacterized protein (TIGR03032 family)
MQKTTLPPFSCTHTPEFPQLLAELECSLLVSTYQAGKIILIGSDGEQLSQLPRTFDTPMGTAFDGRRLAVATRHEVVQLVNEPRLAGSYPSKPDFYDTLFVPRSSHYCGQLNIHDMAWCQDGLVGVNTLFSCLFRLDEFYSFAPLWRPPFISALVSEDRCHLNGMAVVDGQPRYVTALGHSDTHQGWRDNKLEGGILMDVESGEVLLQALPMPHSPRVYDGRLYVLLSALGQLVVVDLAKGTFEVVNQVNGFVRGMARQGDFLFVGSSRLRHKHIFGDLPLAQGETLCGVVAIHLPTGALVGKLEFLNSCEEIYDVQVLPGWRRPGILGTSQPMYQRALSTPEETFWGEDKDER